MAGRRQRDPDDLTGDLVPAPVFTGRQVEILLHIADDNWRHDAGTWDVPDAEIAEIERMDPAMILFYDGWWATINATWALYDQGHISAKRACELLSPARQRLPRTEFQRLFNLRAAAGLRSLT